MFRPKIIFDMIFYRFLPNVELSKLVDMLSPSFQGSLRKMTTW